MSALLVRTLGTTTDRRYVQCQPLIFDPETHSFEDADIHPVLALNLRERSVVPEGTRVVVHALGGHKTGAQPLYVFDR